VKYVLRELEFVDERIYVITKETDDHLLVILDVFEDTLPINKDTITFNKGGALYSAIFVTHKELHSIVFFGSPEDEIDFYS
jgi:hypothetical protein